MKSKDPFLREVYNGFKENWYNWQTLLFLVATFMFHLVWKYFPDKKVFKILTTILFVALLIVLQLKGSQRTSSYFQKALRWSIIGGSVAITIAYLAVVAGWLFIAAWTLILTTVATYFGAIGFAVVFLVILYKQLTLSKKFREVILWYICISIMSIIIFSLVFFFFSAWPTSVPALKFGAENLTKLDRILFYSASVYYSASIGDVMPMGYIGKGIYLIEVMLSAITHTIVLAFAVNKISEQKSSE